MVFKLLVTLSRVYYNALDLVNFVKLLKRQKIVMIIYPKEHWKVGRTVFLSSEYFTKMRDSPRKVSGFGPKFSWYFILVQSEQFLSHNFSALFILEAIFIPKIIIQGILTFSLMKRILN